MKTQQTAKSAQFVKTIWAGLNAQVLCSGCFLLCSSVSLAAFGAEFVYTVNNRTLSSMDNYVSAYQLFLSIR